MFEENEVAVKRINLASHNQAIVMQAAYAASQSKQGNKYFTKLLEWFK